MNALDTPLIMGFSAKTFVFAWLMALPRMAVAFALIPVLSRALFPGLLGISVSAGFALFVAPAVASRLNADVTVGLMLAIGMKECVLGLMLGFTLAAPFWALDMMGFFIDNQRGESISATLNPAVGHDTSTLGQLFSFAFIVYVFTSDGFSRILRVLYTSYALWPPTSFWPELSGIRAAHWLSVLNAMMEMMLMLSAPVILAMLLVELGLALISHFAPQLQVFFLAMPIKSALAIFVLAVYVGTLFDFLGRRLTGTLSLLPRLTALVGS